MMSRRYTLHFRSLWPTSCCVNELTWLSSPSPILKLHQLYYPKVTLPTSNALDIALPRSVQDCIFLNLATILPCKGIIWSLQQFLTIRLCHMVLSLQISKLQEDIFKLLKAALWYLLKSQTPNFYQLMGYFFPQLQAKCSSSIEQVVS